MSRGSRDDSASGASINTSASTYEPTYHTSLMKGYTEDASSSQWTGTQGLVIQKETENSSQEK
jgi:hypothetical protein